MSAPISDVVQVSVTVEAAAVQSQGFGKGLILASHLLWTDRTREYGRTSEMADDGFESTDAAYIAAARYFAQSAVPRKVKVGRRQIDTATVVVDTATDDTSYTITINGTDFTVAYDDATPTVGEVATALRTAINAGSEPVTASGSGADIILTTDVLGDAWTLEIGDLLSVTMTDADTITDDLDAILLEDTDFYGLVLATDRDSEDMQEAADWALANSRLLFTVSAESDVIGVAPASDTTSLPAVLKSEANGRAICFYHADGATNFIDAAAMGRLLAKLPGTFDLDFKDLAGIAVSSLTPTQRANAIGKNCNVYEERGGLNQINDGRTSKTGVYADQAIGRDWLVNEVMTQIFAALSTPDKVPFTDEGIGILENACRGAGQLGVSRGYLASFETSFPVLEDVSATDKANRTLTGATMTVLESGSIHSVAIEITVEV